MTVVIEGNVPETERRPTGLASLDLAFGDSSSKQVGLPVRCAIELYGREESGKSTLAYFLAGCVEPTGVIVLVDLEGGARSEYITNAIGQSGFQGKLRFVDYADKGGERRTHEKMMKIGADMLLEDDVRCVVLDSVAMVTPVMEAEGDFEEAFMGRRAQTVAKFTRRCVSHINYVDDAKLVITINHILGSMKYSNAIVTPGGDTLRYGAVMLARISREETFDDGSFEAQVKVDKMRWGGRSGKTGRVIIQPGMGVSKLATSAFDCMELGLARRESVGVQVLDQPNGEKWITVEKLSALLEAARENKPEIFAAFQERLGWEKSSSIPSTKPKRGKSSRASHKSSAKT